MQQDLADRDARAGDRGDHADTVAGGEVARLHLPFAGFHDHLSWSQSAQHHGHALKYAERTGVLVLAELHHESADEDTAEYQDVEVRGPEPETVAHALLFGVRS